MTILRIRMNVWFRRVKFAGAADYFAGNAAIGYRSISETIPSASSLRCWDRQIL